MTNFGEIFIGNAIAQTQTQTTAPAPAQATKGPGGLAGMFLPMILVFAIFYLLMIRPQAKQQKKHKEMLGQIKKGDEVVTTAGIHGKIAAVADTTLTLEIAENVRIKLEKQQVAQVKGGAAA